MTPDRDTSVVLGISTGFHDAAAALVVDGTIVAAVEEERLSRIKHDPSFPARAADSCLAIAGLDAADVDLVAFHEKPLDVVDRRISGLFRSGPSGVAQLMGRAPAAIGAQLSTTSRLRRWFVDRDAPAPAMLFAEHHVSHAAAAFYPSPFRSAAVLTIDGVGEQATTAMGEGHDHRLRLERDLRFPDSLGLLYSAFTSYCGFAVNGGEGELMGLAPYGRPIHAEHILERLVDLHDDGSFHLDQRFFAYVGGRRTTGRRFHDLFGGPPRPRGSTPGPREADLAASIQSVTEEIVLRMAHELHRVTGLDHLCLAGGVALNCVANGRLATEGPFEGVWVQPAAGDAGNALGAALWAWHEVLGRDRPAPDTDAMSGAFLGPRFSTDEIEAWLVDSGVAHRRCPDDELADTVAERLADGAVVGWFRGRMEFGPRALGHRSILADPRSPTVKARINDLVKERAGFRPFAPAVLADRCGEWFEYEGDAPFMTTVAPVARSRWTGESPTDGDPETSSLLALSDIPAVTHVDRSARIQTVDRDRNPEFAALIESFDRRTGCPVVLNTSFNARDEPIVCTPEDALATFRRTGLDLLVLEHCIVEAS